MSSFLDHLQDIFIARVKNMLLLNFIIAWIIINYEVVMRFLWGDMSVDEKITYIKGLNLGIELNLFYPLLLTLVYIYVIPLLNLLIVIPYNKYVDRRIKDHKNNILTDYYERSAKVEEAKITHQDFARKRLEIKLEKEKNEEKEKAIKLTEKENKANEEAIRVTKEKNSIVKEAHQLNEIINYIELKEKLKKEIFELIEQKEPYEENKNLKKTNKNLLDEISLLKSNQVIEEDLIKKENSFYLDNSKYLEKHIIELENKINSGEKTHGNYTNLCHLLLQTNRLGKALSTVKEAIEIHGETEELLEKKKRIDNSIIF